MPQQSALPSSPSRPKPSLRRPLANLRRWTARPPSRSRHLSSALPNTGALTRRSLCNSTSCHEPHHVHPPPPLQPLPPNFLSPSSQPPSCHHPPLGSSLILPPEDPYAALPSLNRDIWPLLPPAIPFLSSSSSAHTPLCVRPFSSRLPSADWTVKLDVDFSDHTAASPLFPPPARFKNGRIAGHHRPVKGFTTGRKRAAAIHQARQSYRRPHHFTYPSLARPEPEQARLAPPRLDTFAGGPDLSRPGHLSSYKWSRSRYYRHRLSSLRSRSSASTDRLHKPPSSDYHSSAQPPRRRAPRVRQRRPAFRFLSSSSTGTSAKDVSGTFNSLCTGTSREGKLSFKHETPSTAQLVRAPAGQPHKLDSDLSTSSNPVHHSSSPYYSLFSIASSEFPPRPSQQPENPARPTSLHNDTSLSPPNSQLPLAQAPEPSKDHASISHRPAQGENSGKPGWNEEQLALQVVDDPSRIPYPHFKSSFPEPTPSRSAQRRKKTKPRVKAVQPSWEYQVTQQLLLQSQAAVSQTLLSPAASSKYYSFRSPSHAPSPEGSNSRKLSSTSSSHRKSPSSSFWPCSPSSSSAPGTLESFLSQWSRDLSYGCHTTSLAQRMAIVETHCDRGLDVFHDMEEIEMGILSRSGSTTSSWFFSPGQTSSGVNVIIPNVYLRDAEQSGSQESFASSCPRPCEGGPRTPNHITHHDQADLLSSVGCSVLNSLETGNLDHTSSRSSGLWYDAADVAIIEESEAVESDRGHSKRSTLPSPHPLHRRTRRSTIPLRRAVSAAIVYDIPFSTVVGDGSSSWLKKASQLCASSPTLQPSTLISSVRKHGRDCKDQLSTSTSHSHLLPGPSVGIPFPPQKLPTRSIFSPSDDPNFLKRPAHQLKSTWKKTHHQNLRKPARNTWRGLPLSRAVPFQPYGDDEQEEDNDNDNNNNNNNNNDDDDDDNDNDDACAASPVKRTSNQNAALVRRIDQEGTKREFKQLDDSGGNLATTLVAQKISSQTASSDLINLSTLPMILEPSSTTALESDHVDKESHSGRFFTLIDTLALVPINGWCFVFGFILFPLWYIGSFYPSLDIKSTVAPSQSCSDLTRNVNIPLLLQSQRRMSAASRPCSLAGMASGCSQGSPQRQLLRISLPEKRREICNSNNGPISGWPTLRHMISSSFDLDRSPAQVECSGRNFRSCSVSSTEANRQPDFDQAQAQMSVIGGFWSEIAPRVDVESAQALDAPIWAFQRAVYTWRLRCRVMSVVFSILALPAILISIFVCK